MIKENKTTEVTVKTIDVYWDLDEQVHYKALGVAVNSFDGKFRPPEHLGGKPLTVGGNILEMEMRG